MPPLLFISTPLLCFCPQLFLPPYSFLSPPQPSCFSTIFGICFLPVGSCTLSGLIYYSCPHIPPSPVANTLYVSSSRIFLLFQFSSSVFSYFSVLLFVSSVYFFLLTLCCYAFRKCHRRALFSANLEHSHLEYCHEVGLTCHCSFFFHSVCKLPCSG